MEWKLSELAEEGKPMNMILEDSQSDPKQAVSAFNNLVEVKGANVVFSTLSGVSMALKPMAEEKGVLLWADVAHPALTNGSWAIRHANLASTDAQSLADRINSDGIRKVGVLYQQDDWGTAYFNSLDEDLRKSGIDVVAQGIDWKGSDFRTEISKIKDADAIATIVAGNGAGLIIRQARELGFEGQFFSSVGLVLTPDAIAAAKDYLNGTFYQTYRIDPRFAEDFRAKFGKEPSIMNLNGDMIIYTVVKKWG